MFNNWYRKKTISHFAGFGGGAGGTLGVGGSSEYATGGIINDYEESGTYYRAHILFPGTFEVVNDVTTVDWL